MPVAIQGALEVVNRCPSAGERDILQYSDQRTILGSSKGFFQRSIALATGGGDEVVGVSHFECAVSGGLDGQNTGGGIIVVLTVTKSADIRIGGHGCSTVFNGYARQTFAEIKGVGKRCRESVDRSCGAIALDIVVADIKRDTIATAGGLDGLLQLASDVHAGQCAGLIGIRIHGRTRRNRAAGQCNISRCLIICVDNRSFLLSTVHTSNQNGVYSILVVCIVEAVVLAGDTAQFSAQLGCIDIDSNVINTLVLILVARRLLHMAFDGQSIRCTGSKGMVCTQIGIIDRPVDHPVQFSVALNAGDDNLILQRQITLVDNPQLRQLIGAARLPEDLCALRRNRAVNLKLQGFAFSIDPVAAIVFHLKRDVQITRLDFVHAGACCVGEPRKRCADEHGHAQNKCDDAREQLALRAVSGFHM